MKGQTSIGSHRHLVSVFSVGMNVADGDGGFTQSVTPLSPATWYCSITPATARDLERRAAGTVIAQATHVLRGRVHPGITTQTRITFGARTFNVTGRADLEERGIELEVLAVEVVT